MAFDFDAWIRQPTTLHGLAVAAAGIGVALAHVATGNPKIDAACGIIAYVAMHIGIDDNSTAERAVTAVATDAVAVVSGKGVDPTKALTDAAAAAGAVKGLMAAPAPQQAAA